MDVRTSHTTKIVLFLAAALLLALPSYADDTVLTVTPASTPSAPLTIGQSSCNSFQVLNLTSTGTVAGPIAAQASIQYDTLNSQNQPVYGPWLYARWSSGAGSATGATTTNSVLVPVIPVTIPAASNPAGPAGVNLTIGLNLSTLGTNTDTARVILHVSSPFVADMTVYFKYQFNLSCGGSGGSVSDAFESITPGSISLTAAQGTSATLTPSILVQNLTGNSISFTVGPASSSNTWLSAVASSSTIPPNGSVAVGVTATAGSTMAVNTYTDSLQFIFDNTRQLNVPVSFQVTAGNGGGNTGTLTLNGTTSNVANLSFTYIAAGPNATGVPTSQNVTLTSSNPQATTYSDNFTTSSGGSWLNVNGNSFSPQAGQSIANPMAIQPNNIITTLSTGVYFATVNLISADGSPATVNVTLSVSGGSAPGVTVSPGLVYAYPGVTVGATTPESVQFKVTAASGVILGGITQQPSQPIPGVFSMNVTLNTAAEQDFTLTVNPTGLAAGTYSDVIQISSSGTSSGTTYIVVTFVVSSNSGTGCTTNCGGSVTSVVVPTSLTFATTYGDNKWTGFGTTQAITITGASGTQWSASVTYNDTAGNAHPWVCFGNGGLSSGTFGDSPATLIVNYCPVSTLPASSTAYSATIAVTTPSGTTNVAVTLSISNANSPTLLASPASTTFYYSGTGTGPAAQSFIVGATDMAFPPTQGSTPVISLSTTGTASWLTPTASGNRVNLSVNISGVATGAYSTVVNISSPNYPNTIPYPVVLVVGNGIPIGGTGPLTLTPTSMTFNATAGSGVPGSQQLQITAASSTNVTLSVSQGTCTPSSSATWLSVTPNSNFVAGTTATNLTVAVNQAGLAASTVCNGSISMQTSSGTQSVAVTLNVSSSGTSGNVTVTPSGPLTFAYTTGGSTPTGQALHIVNSASGSAQTPFTVQTSQNWITVSATNASTPFDLTVGVNPSGLSASSTPYSGTVTITPSGGTPVVVNVSLTVSAVPTVTASPTTLSFSYTAGGNNPPTQTVNISGGGSASPFTVTTQSNGNWLKVSANSGTTPNSGTFPLVVSADPTGLNAGITYNGTITVAGQSPATGTTIISVSFQVSAPLPTIIGVKNAASGAAGPFSPGEIVTLYANPSNPIGPASLVKLDNTTCPSPCTQVPNSMGGVQVVFLPIGVNAPIIYVSSTQVAAVIPYEAAGVANLQVEVKFLGQASNAFVLQSAAANPAIFTQNQQGNGLGAVLVYDTAGNFLGTNSSSVPAGVGYVLSIFGTGEGQTSPAGVTGKVTTNATTVPILAPTTCLVGGQPANVPYSGEAPGLVSGVWQVNCTVPAGAGTGPVTLSLGLGGNFSTQAGVQVYLK